MKTSKQAKRDAKALFRGCMVEGLLDENRVRRIIDEVVQVKPRGYVPILQHFLRLVKLDSQRRAATIESSGELSAEQRRTIEDQLRARYGRGLTFTYAVDPGLIGGVRIRAGSDVYDGSVVGRLQALQESFQVV